MAGRAARARRLGAMLAAGGVAYALASGAVTGPGVWAQHVRYLFGGGITGVDRIDHASPVQWAGLLACVASLVRGSLGLGAALLGVLGLALLARERPGRGLLLAGGLLATPLLFVLPIGFVYARFLLVPLAALCAGLAVLVVRVAEGPRRKVGGAGALGAVACAALVLAGDRQVYDYHRQVVPAVDARLALAEALPRHVPDGARLVVFADEREHGPPLDPRRWRLEVEGLDAAERRLREWAAAPHEQRPEHVLWMSFPTDRPSGRPTAREPLPAPGTRVGGVFEVLAVRASPGPGLWAVRSIAVRPDLVLLRRLP